MRFTNKFCDPKERKEKRACSTSIISECWVNQDGCCVSQIIEFGWLCFRDCYLYPLFNGKRRYREVTWKRLCWNGWLILCGQRAVLLVEDGGRRESEEGNDRGWREWLSERGFDHTWYVPLLVGPFVFITLFKS